MFVSFNNVYQYIQISIQIILNTGGTLLSKLIVSWYLSAYYRNKVTHLNYLTWYICLYKQVCNGEIEDRWMLTCNSAIFLLWYINILIFNIYFQVRSWSSYLIFVHFSFWYSLTDTNVNFLNKEASHTQQGLRILPMGLDSPFCSTCSLSIIMFPDFCFRNYPVLGLTWNNAKR